MRAWPRPYIPKIPGTGVPVAVQNTATGDRTVVGDGDAARLYVCGITPYDAAHLGHAATYVTFDLLVRAWIDNGVDVTYVQNVTDVDDPLLERANATGVEWEGLAHRELDRYRADSTALGIIPPDHLVGVVETVPEIADAVAGLLERGHAYRVDDDVYADLAADADFGGLSGLSADSQRAVFAERGGDPDRADKRDPLDPLLWRAARDGEPSWPHDTLGAGRPGWHVECSVISSRLLGNRVDVTGGGTDLIFPHHEMSTSHVRLMTGESKPSAAFVHTGMVGLDGEKMSKSKGNLVFVHELLARGVHPMAVRLALLSMRYDTDWSWTEDHLTRSGERLERWLAAFSAENAPDAQPTIATVRRAIADDLDAPSALAAVDEWAERVLSPVTSDDCVEGAAGVMSRSVDALLGVRF